MSAVSGIPLPLPLAPLLVSSASQTLRCLKSWDGSCSRQRPAVLMRWAIRSRSAVDVRLRLRWWTSWRALNSAGARGGPPGVPPPIDGSNCALASESASIGANSSLVLKI